MMSIYYCVYVPWYVNVYQSLIKTMPVLAETSVTQPEIIICDNTHLTVVSYTITTIFRLTVVSYTITTIFRSVSLPLGSENRNRHLYYIHP